MVMNWSSSAASRKLICRNESGARSPASPSMPQISDARCDRSGQLPRRTGAEIVQSGPVDGDRAHATGVTRHLRRGRDDVGDVGGRPLAERRGERIGAEVDRQPGALVVVHVGQQRQHRLGGGDEVGAGVENHRHEVEEHALEQPVQVGRRDAVGRADPQRQRAHPLGQGDQDSAVAVGDGLLARERETPRRPSSRT